jgi:NADH-quinone oxidoreductase subunit F
MGIIQQLQEIQNEYGYLPVEAVEALGGSAAEHLGTASFYQFFKLEEGPDEDHTERLFDCRKKGPLLDPLGIRAKEVIENALADPEGTISMLKEAKLCGRGGAGFPTGMKWETTAKIDAPQKYVVCNADEGEPDTGKDRILLEENPQSVITGIAACAAAVGADRAYIYLRGEYADVKERLEETIQTLPLQQGLKIEVLTGMGAYVCGEETALLNSIEGKRGEPRLKPPFPGVAGLYRCPTVINNVETFACVAYILSNGAEAFLKKGDQGYPGMKLYTVAGDVECPGVYEAKTGITVEELLALAGGMKDHKNLLAIQVGGGSGKLLFPEALAMRMTPEGCKEYGTGLGTGSVHFLAEGTDIKRYVEELTRFYAAESCGCCVPCRAGLWQLLEMLENPECGQESIRSLAEYVRDGARCALGAAAVTPLLSWLDGKFKTGEENGTHAGSKTERHGE